MNQRERLDEIEKDMPDLSDEDGVYLLTRVCTQQAQIADLVAALEQRPNLDAETFESIKTSFKHEYDTWETIARTALEKYRESETEREK